MQRRSEPSSSAWPWGNGLALFAHHHGAGRTRRLVFVGLVALVAGLLTWPIYPRFAVLAPSVLGLPFGFAWVIACLTVVFVALVWLYRADGRDDHRSR